MQSNELFTTPRKTWIKPAITGVSSLRSAEATKTPNASELEVGPSSKIGPAS